MTEPLDFTLLSVHWPFLIVLFDSLESQSYKKHDRGLEFVRPVIRELQVCLVTQTLKIYSVTSLSPFVFYNLVTRSIISYLKKFRPFRTIVPSR